MSLFRKRAAIIGTYVSESSNAPMMQKTRVCAIGVKYLPSMPLSVSMGKKTMRMMSTANVELCTTFAAPSVTSSSISSRVRCLPYRRRL